MKIEYAKQNTNQLSGKLVSLSLVSIQVVRIASTWLQARFLSFPGTPWPLHGCNDRRYSYFTRNICKPYINSFETLFRTSSQACSAIVTTMETCF